MKKPSILEDAQVHAALAGTLVPDLMRQKMEAENQAATALSFLSLLGFQTGEGSPLPLEQQVQNYIRAKEDQEANLREATQRWDGTKRQLAEAAQAEEEGKIALSTLEKKLLKAEETRANQEAAYIIMEQKLAEAAQEREKTKSQLTRMLQEHIDIKDGTTAFGDEEFGANLAQVIDLKTVPTFAQENQTNFFAYLESLKDGQNDLIIESTKSTYTNVYLQAHRAKMIKAIEYLKTAQITANQVTEQLTKAHQAEMEAARIAMEKKLAEIVQEQIGTNEVALPGIGEVTANVANLTVPTLLTHAKPNQSAFFEYSAEDLSRSSSKYFWQKSSDRTIGSNLPGYGPAQWDHFVAFLGSLENSLDEHTNNAAKAALVYSRTLAGSPARKIPATIAKFDIEITAAIKKQEGQMQGLSVSDRMVLDIVHQKVGSTEEALSKFVSQLEFGGVFSFS